MAQINLAPLNPLLGVNPDYCVPTQTTLVLKEKIWSLSGDTRIVDENGIVVVQCRGKELSLSNRKQFADVSGRPLLSLRMKLLSFYKSFYAEAADGSVLFEVKGKSSVWTSKMIATFTNASDEAPIELLVKGDWLDRRATITLGDIVVAQISRSFHLREIFASEQSYFVTVAPNVDLSLIAAICVCMDENEEVMQ